MIRFFLLSLLVISCLIVAGAPAASAQSTDRAGLLVKLDSLRDQQQKKEATFLAPAAEDFAAYSEFLKQPDTGMARLMPREKYDGTLLINGGGAYYSFTRLTNEYGYGSDIELQQGKLQVGFAGADFGFMTSLGDVPIDSVTADDPGIHFLADFNTPSAEAEARAQYRRSGEGFMAEGFTYRNSLTATSNTSYALRSISYGDSDVLVALRVTRQDADGSVVLAWKVLKRFPVPQLVRTPEL